MKVALILGSNLANSPYVKLYTKILKKKKINYDLITWNREGIVERETISFNLYANSNKSRLFRISAYLNYRKFVLNILKNSDYQKIVVFTVFLGFLLHPFLKKRYRNSYLFDVRDHSPLLNYLPKIIKPIINDSFATVISSPGFIKWLPVSDKYVISHNYHFDRDLISEIPRNQIRLKFIILTIGLLRDFDTNKRLINLFKDRDDISLKFVGRGIAYEPLLNFAQYNDIKNVVFTGGYEKKFEFIFLKDVSLINILLDDGINSKTLMTNRLYLAVSNKIPVLVIAKTTQAEYVQKYNLGLTIENVEESKYLIIDYLNNFKRDLFLKGCKDFISEVEVDQKIFENCLESFFKKN